MHTCMQTHIYTTALNASTHPWSMGFKRLVFLHVLFGKAERVAIRHRKSGQHDVGKLQVREPQELISCIEDHKP